MTDDPLLDAILTDFSDHLVPEAFLRATTADRVFLEDPPPDLPPAGRFDAWVEQRLSDALAVSWPHDQPETVVYLSDGELCWRFDDCGCGYIECPVRATAEDALAIGTPWVLAAWLPRPRPTWETVTDADGTEVDEVLVAPPTEGWSVTWYAEARGRGLAASRAGLLLLDGPVVTSWIDSEPRVTPVGKRLHRVLHRHPARRRHPLRRRRDREPPP